MYSYKKKIIIALVGTIIIGFIAIIGASAVRTFLVEGPKYSVGSGFYEEPFQLEINTLPGVSVYYTLDGSEPTIHSKKYTEPIVIDDASDNPNIYSALTGMSGTYGDYIPAFSIDKATVVKAIAVIGNYHSEVSTAIYFVGFRDKPGYDNIKIMSMIVDPDDLFSDEGIYVIGTLAGKAEEGVEYAPPDYPANYNIESSEMRRKAHITLWDAERNMLADEDLAVGIHGGWSKSLRQKGFNFYHVKEYGPDDYGFDHYMLRTSGSRDSLQTMFRDVLNQELVADRDLGIQRSTPCILFINGEYWGIYNLQQRYTESYFKEVYGIDEDNIICIKEGLVTQGKESDIAYYNELIAFAVNNDLALAENYEQIGRMMDIQSFIDYYAFECYVGNVDWPINNECCFRSRKTRQDSEYEDGRWRWAAYDTDVSDNIGWPNERWGSTDINPFSNEAHYTISPLDTDLMRALRQNADFCRQFQETFINMAHTDFEYTNVKNHLYEYAAVYRKPMTMTMQRFNTMDYTEDDFDEYVYNIDCFFRDRARYVLPYLEEIDWKVD